MWTMASQSIRKLGEGLSDQPDPVPVHVERAFPNPRYCEVIVMFSGPVVR